MTDAASSAERATVAPTPADPLDFLYPEIEPDESGFLEETASGHQVWWEASGARDGCPILLVHGGPGAPSSPRLRRFFDPEAFRLYTLHQRGCGKSRPLAETHDNHTQALIKDFERLRNHVGVERWNLAGGSWGSALALAYGEAHPERCLGFALTGITLAREVDRVFWWEGTRLIFPEAWDAATAVLDPDERADPMRAFHRRLTDPDPAVHLPATKALLTFSAATVGLAPDAAALASYEDPEVGVPLARISVHYNLNHHFLPPTRIENDLHRIAHLPAAIVHGRYDLTTIADAAWRLHRAWPGSTLEIVQGAHSLREPGMARAWLSAIDSLRPASRVAHAYEESNDVH